MNIPDKKVSLWIKSHVSSTLTFALENIHNCPETQLIDINVEKQVCEISEVRGWDIKTKKLCLEVEIGWEDCKA